jgi:hypothetical protein
MPAQRDREHGREDSRHCHKESNETCVASVGDRLDGGRKNVGRVSCSYIVPLTPIWIAHHGSRVRLLGGPEASRRGDFLEEDGVLSTLALNLDCYRRLE